MQAVGPSKLAPSEGHHGKRKDMICRVHDRRKSKTEYKPRKAQCPSPLALKLKTLHEVMSCALCGTVSLCSDEFWQQVGLRLHRAGSSLLGEIMVLWQLLKSSQRLSNTNRHKEQGVKESRSLRLQTHPVILCGPANSRLAVRKRSK